MAVVAAPGAARGRGGCPGRCIWPQGGGGGVAVV